MKVGFLITGRLKSTRLPKKLLLEICSRPILCHMIDRIKLSKMVDEIVLCTSTNKQDDPLEELAHKEQISVFRGDEDDVVKRLYDASVQYNLDYLLNITADCPFVDPVYADEIVKAYESTGADLIRAFGLPHGAFSYGIRPPALKKVIEIKEDRETEVWGRYFTDTDLFNVYDLPIENPLHRQPGLRMTLDYPEDLAFFEAVFDHLYKEDSIFSLDEILNFLQKHPEIVMINRDCAKSFLKRFRRQGDIYLKPRYDITKAAIIGCGSIGQRHIRNLRKLGIADIVALRSRKGHYQDLPAELAVHEVDDWQKLFEQGVDIAIVSNPTSMHMDTASRLLGYAKGLFVEKPLGDSIDKIDKFLEQVEKSKTILYVGYNLVFHKGVQVVKEFLRKNDIGAPLSFQAQVGHWLPEWHPYEDFKKAYYARKDLGGGVIMTLIHEIHLAQEFFGDVASVYGLISPSDVLPLEVDTIADLMMHHKSGVVSQLHLDFVQRPLHRSGVISCERGWIRYDLANGIVFAQIDGEDTPECLWKGTDYDSNQQYLDEMQTFLRFVREGRIRHLFDAWHAAQTMAIVDAAFASVSCGAVKEVAD